MNQFTLKTYEIIEAPVVEAPVKTDVFHYYTTPATTTATAPQPAEFCLQQWYNTPRQSILVNNVPFHWTNTDIFNTFISIGWVSRVEITTTHTSRSAVVFFDYWYFTDESIDLRDSMTNYFPSAYMMPNRLCVSPNTDPNLIYVPGK